MSAIASPPPGQGFVKAKYLARLYATTEPTIYRWAKENKIPSIRFQDTIRFDLEAVRAVIEGRPA
jgi:excisionase family DNA binding protein